MSLFIAGNCYILVQQRKRSIITLPQKHYRLFKSGRKKNRRWDPGLKVTTHLTVVAALSVGAHGVSCEGAGRGVATRVHTLLQQKNTPQQVTAGKPDLLSAGSSERTFPVWVWEGSCSFILTVVLWRCTNWGSCVLDLRLVQRGVCLTQ